MICLVVFLSLAIGVSLAATAPAAVWEKSYGTPAIIDTGASVWQTDDCGFIITGQTYTKGVNSGITRLMLVKTDWQGNEQWIKYDDDCDGGKFVRQTSDGGYVVTGTNAGSLFVLKTDKNGEKVWSKSYPRPNGKTVAGYAVHPLSDGGYIVAGSINLGGKDGSDMYATKIDATGNQQWEKTYGGDDGDVGNGADFCYSVWPTSDGGYILGGNDWSSTYWPKAALVKIDADGNQQWYKVYSESDARMDGGFIEVQQTRDGGYIWAGIRSGKMCLLKADANGNQQWNQSYEGGQCYSVQQTWDDGYVLTGSAGTAANEVIVIRTDSAGNKLWQKNLKGMGLGKGYSVQQIGNGSYVVAGLTKTDSKAQDDFYLGQLDKDFTPVPNAQFISPRNAYVMDAGKFYQLTVTMANSGTMPWTFQDGTILAPFYDSEDTALFSINNYTIPIGTVIRPGQSISVDFTYTAPAMNGTYHPAVSMYRVNHGYFGETARLEFRVVNGTPDTRTPTAAPTAAPTSGATEKPTAQPTAQGTSGPTKEPGSGNSDGSLPCLPAVILPLLIVGTVTIGIHKRRNK